MASLIEQSVQHILVIVLLLPLLGALLIALIPDRHVRLIRLSALGISLLTLIFTLALLSMFDPSNAGMQFSEQYIWNARLGTSFSFGVDGFSMPMLILTTLLAFVALTASLSIKEKQKGYYILMLILEAAILGVFMAQDWALFYVFWEMTLIPLFFLIDRYGGKERQRASLNFVLYTLGGSVFILISLLALFDSTSQHSFSHEAFIQAGKVLDAHNQWLIFLGLLIGFGVKIPIFPLHGWLPLAHVEAPSPVSILLSGILLKMGAYGLLRAVQILPLAAELLQGVLFVIAVICILYGGLLAWRQSDLKRMIAYSSVSHMGIVLLGISTANSIGLTGAVVQMFAHGLVAGAAFLLIGLLYERTKTRDVTDYSSLIKSTPRFAFFMTLAFIAAVGMPGTVGFIAELHTIIGGFQEWGWFVLVISLGMMISAAYAVRTIGRLFTGPVQERMQGVTDLRFTELVPVVILIVTIIAFGFSPDPLIQLSSGSITDIAGGL